MAGEDRGRGEDRALSGGGRDEHDLAARVATLSLEQKVRLFTGADFCSLHAGPAVGLRRLVVSDGPAGVPGEPWDEREPSANVPSPTALAATWDEALTAALTVAARTLQHWDCGQAGWIAEPGPFGLAAGSSAVVLPLSGQITVT